MSSAGRRGDAQLERGAALDAVAERDLLCFRTVRSTLIPYVPLVVPTDPFAPRKFGEPELHQARNAIASITVGPTPNMSLSVEAVLAYCSIHEVCQR
jgi:hypothetical protein